MAPSPDPSSDLFAAKGRAAPAGTERLVKRAVTGTPPAQGRASAQESGLDSDQPPGQTDEKPQDDGPASVLSIDLRSALVSAPLPLRQATTAPAPWAAIPPPPQPQNDSMAGPLIAAVVAISIASGLFYIFGTEHPGLGPTADTPAGDAPAAGPAATPVAEAKSAPPEDPARAAAAGQPLENETGAAQDAEASDNPDKAEDAAGGGTLPSFDLVRVEPDGSAVIAGRAAPYAELILLHNGEPIGKATADWAGEWAFVSDRPLPADRHTIAILVNDPDAEITLPDGADPPARLSDLVNSQPR